MSVLIDRDDLLERIKAIPISSGMVKARILETVRNAPTVGEGTNATAWISVKDRLPEHEQEVLVQYSFDVYDHDVRTYMTEDTWYGKAERWYGYEDWCTTDKISYWMPMPESPREDKI